MSHRRAIHRLATDSRWRTSRRQRFLRFAVAGTGGFIVQVGRLPSSPRCVGVNYLVATVVGGRSGDPDKLRLARPLDLA